MFEVFGVILVLILNIDFILGHMIDEEDIREFKNGLERAIFDIWVLKL